MTITSLPAGAATFTVTNLNDSGAGSLRQAITDANALLGTDTIAFQAGLTGTITLTSGQISIADALTINGPGANVLAVSGNKASRIFYLSNADGSDAMAGKVLTINGLTLRDGKSSGSGGAIGTGGGGGASLLTLNNCVLTGNTALSGGAIWKSGGSVTLNNSTVIYNGASADGGGIENSNGRVTVNNSTLAYNTAIQGGGIHHGSTNNQQVIVNNSTVFGNSASTGGGIYSSFYLSKGSLSLNNSTISANSAANRGGGIWFSGYFANDSGTLANNIVAGNIAPEGKEIYREIDGAPDGALTSLGHNLFGENGAAGLVNVTKAASDLVLPSAIATALGPLADHGGPTQTQLPRAGSPALNAGDNALIPAGATTDQRGAGFPRIVNGTVDIGAAEVQPSDSLVAGLTGTGQIYYTAVTVTPPLDGEPLADDDALPVPPANAWGSLPGQLARLSVGDFNGDGEGDLVGIASNGTIWYTTNRGPWTQVPGGLSQISIGDFTGTGQDGLAGLSSDGSVWYTTTMTGWTQVSGQLSQLVTGDFNGDGRADLAGLANNGSIWYSTNLTTWTQAPGALAQLRAGDLNGDGKADLAGIASNGSVWYSTTLNGWTQVPGGLAQLQVGDLNGDGQADLAGIASNGSVWYSTTLNGWTQVPGALSQLTVSDLNGDGHADLTGLSANGAIWYSTDLAGWNNLPGQLAQLAER